MDELDYNYLAELVLKTQRGDSEAFAELYTATYSETIPFCLPLCKGCLSCTGYSSGCIHSGIEKYQCPEESPALRLLAEPDYIPHLL